jgi:transcriptional regulator of acetoin/glycerol metabolism
MPRPVFAPNDEQRATLAVLARLAEVQARLNAEADEAIRRAKQQDIPISHIAETLRVERKTIYRHLGHPMR